MDEKDDEVHVFTAQEFQRLLRRMDALETSNRSQSARIHELEQESSEHEHRVSTLNKQADALQAELVRVRSDKLAQLQQIDHLTGTLATARVECARLVERNVALWGADRELDRLYVHHMRGAGSSRTFYPQALRYLQGESTAACSAEFKRRVGERLLVMIALGEWSTMAAQANGSAVTYRSCIDYTYEPSDAEVLELVTTVLAASMWCCSVPVAMAQRALALPGVVPLIRAMITGGLVWLGTTPEEKHLAVVLSVLVLVHQAMECGHIKNSNAGSSGLRRICGLTRYPTVATWIHDSVDQEGLLQSKVATTKLRGALLE